MKYLAKYIVMILAVIFVQDTLAQDGDAVFNKIIKEYTLNTDGSTEYREYKEVELHSHMSFHRLYGETFIVFDPEYQEIVINEAFTIMKDGQKVVVPDNAFNEVLPRSARNAAPYNHLRELVITHTGLEVGATIYLDYTIKTKPGYIQTFMGEEMIRDIVPIHEKKIVVRIPQDQELKYKVLNLRTGPEITEDKGMKVYTFSFKSLSPYTREWGTDYELLPRLFFSAAKDLERAYFPFVSQPAFTYRVNEAMVNAAEKIRKESDDDLKAILAIQKMVVSDLGTWNLPLEYAGFRCRTPEETWNSNAGTTIEKTVLLATLLMQADFSAVPVAIIPEKYYDRTVGSLYMINDFAVQVRLGSEIIYISAVSTSSQNLAYSSSEIKFLILDGAIESLKTYSIEPGKTKISYQGKLAIDTNKVLKGNINIKLSGEANPYFSLYQDSAYAKRYGSGVKEAKITKLEIDESIFDLQIEKHDDVGQYGEYAFIDIPSSNAGVSSWNFSYIESERNTPIKLRGTLTEKYHFEIEIPEGMDLLESYNEIKHDNDIGTVEIVYRQNGNKVFITRNLEIKKQLVTHNEFGVFNTIWKAWMNASYKKLVFKINE